jgi:hypothetical protein
LQTNYESSIKYIGPLYITSGLFSIG